MNGPEILHVIRDELQQAVGLRGRPPAPRSINASPWVAMSTMQKAIRRGREDLALGAAATLLRDSPDRLWRRIGCVAFEDVGIGCLDAVGLATVALAGKQVRAALGGEWAVASCVVSELCRVPKCRAADDLLMASELHPAYAVARADLPYLTTRELIAVATGQGSVQERALALWFALGTDRRRSTLMSRRGEPQVVFDYLCEAGWPHSIVEVAREEFRRTSEMLCPLVALLTREQREATRVEDDDLPPEVMIGDVPSWALDIFSRDGTECLVQVEERSVSSGRTSRWCGHRTRDVHWYRGSLQLFPMANSGGTRSLPQIFLPARCGCSRKWQLRSSK